MHCMINARITDHVSVPQHTTRSMWESKVPARCPVLTETQPRSYANTTQDHYVVMDTRDANTISQSGESATRSLAHLLGSHILHQKTYLSLLSTGPPPLVSLLGDRELDTLTLG